MSRELARPTTTLRVYSVPSIFLASSCLAKVGTAGFARGAPNCARINELRTHQ
jgi:hypothetical protein